MDKSIPPLMCNTPPPMDDGFEDDDEEEVSVGSVEDSSAPSTPSKHKSLNDDLPVPEELPALPHIITEKPIPAKIIPPSEDIFIKPPVDLDSNEISSTNNEQIPPEDNWQDAPPAVDATEDEKRCESPPSLELHDPTSTDLSFDDPTLDDIPEDDFYTNTELSLPSLRLELIVDSPPEINHLNCLTDASPNQHTEDDFSSASKDLIEDDLVLPPIETPSLEFEPSIYKSPPLDRNDSLQSISSAGDAPNVSYLHPEDFTSSFDEFVEFEETDETREVITDVDLNTTNKDLPTSLVSQTNHSSVPEPELPTMFDDTEKSQTDISPSSDEIPSEDSNDPQAFVVDFSQFNAFESAPPTFVDNNDDDDDDFGDFNDFSTPQEFVPDFPSSHSIPAQTIVAAEDGYDDDFGDFSTHFQSSQPTIVTLPTNVKDVCAKVDSLLAMMFPISQSDTVEDSGTDAKSHVESEDLLSDITLAVRNVDDSKALQHQWLTSTTKGSLVMALGIDSRNILYGGKWNSSMPRFAANLGFTPLEPTKSAGGGSASGGATTDVPAAQFDWNSSGLVNPLDGVQEILHEANVAQNRTSRSDVHWPLRAAPRPSSEEAHLPSGSAPAAQSTTSIQINQSPIVQESLIPANVFNEDDTIPTPVSASYVVPGSGTLKETHIFTPSKVIVPVGVNEHADACRTESVVRIDENVVKKEYHDIEYNPKQLSPAIVDDFSDFQSVKEVREEPQMLQPIQAGIVINWPDPVRLTGLEMESFDQFAYDDSAAIESITDLVDVEKGSLSLETFSKEPISFSSHMERDGSDDYKPSPKFSNNLDFFSDSKDNADNCIMHTVGTDLFTMSPTNHIQLPSSSTLPVSEDTTKSAIKSQSNGFVEYQQTSFKNDSFDEFSDFQSVPMPVLQAPQISSTTVVQMSKPLEPTSLLVPTTIQPTSKSASQIAWPDPGIDSDEMARLEAIFPTPKTISLPNPVTVKSGSPKRQGTVDEVEWTDFVSSSAGLQPITHIINQNILKHQQEVPTVTAAGGDDDWSDFVSSTTSATNQRTTLATGPNFPSWNAASTSFGSWTPVQNSLKPSSKPDIAQISNRMPTVSLIPDLGFVAPAPPSFIRGSASTSSFTRNNGSAQSISGAPVRK